MAQFSPGLVFALPSSSQMSQPPNRVGSEVQKCSLSNRYQRGLYIVNLRLRTCPLSATKMSNRTAGPISQIPIACFFTVPVRFSISRKRRTVHCITLPSQNSKQEALRP